VLLLMVWAAGSLALSHGPDSSAFYAAQRHGCDRAHTALSGCVAVTSKFLAG